MRRLLPLLGLPFLLACPDGEPPCDGGRCEGPAEGQPVRIDRFEATPDAVAAGGAATLSWQSANAALCTLEPGYGAVPRSGSLEVWPQASTTYRLSCEGRGGPAEAETSVALQGGDPVDAGAVDAGPDDSGPPLLLEGELDLADGPFDGAEGLVTSEGALVFHEQQGLLLAEEAPCDAHLPAAFPEERSPAACRIAAGTLVDSWLVHFQPAEGGPAEASGSLAFAAPIVGLILGNGVLDASDELLGHPEGTYLQQNDRGAGETDSVTLGVDRRTVELVFGAGPGAIDQVRVITSASAAFVRSLSLEPLEVPADLGPGAAEGQRVALLDEGLHTLSTALAVDLTAPGAYGVNAPTAQTPGGELAAGTTVRSYLWHVDAPGEPLAEEALEVVASATFPRPVLAVIVDDGRLDAADGALGHDDVTYPAGESSRGLELDSTDTVWLSDDGYSVEVSFAVYGAFVDQLRVILAP